MTIQVLDSADGRSRSITAFPGDLGRLDDFVLDIEQHLQARGYRTTSVRDRRHKRR